MASKRNSPAAPAADPAKAINPFAYGELKDEKIVKKTAPVTIREEACVLLKRPHALQIVVEPKNFSPEIKDVTKAIHACRDHDPITFRLLDATETVVSERQLRFADLKVLEGTHIINELALRSPVRFAGSLRVAHLESVAEEGDVVKVTFVTGDKTYGARTVILLPKLAPLPSMRVEVVNLPSYMG
ncbi:MAG: hypothetical protein IV100_29430 [Myxococcales bacterium]|nr:hypothetical protein [Myxococcales bacterium]